MKTVYVVCATGIATSTMLRLKVEEYLKQRGIDANVLQFRVTEISPDRTEADAIVATTEIPPEFKRVTKVIDGLSLITGIGEQETLEKLARALGKRK